MKYAVYFKEVGDNWVSTHTFDTKEEALDYEAFLRATMNTRVKIMEYSDDDTV